MSNENPVLCIGFRKDGSHIVFALKYRRQVIYREITIDIGQILRKLCEQKGVEIIEANACSDHIYMLISITPNTGYLK